MTIEVLKRASAPIARENVLPKQRSDNHDLAVDGIDVALTCRVWECHARPTTTSGDGNPRIMASTLRHVAKRIVDIHTQSRVSYCTPVLMSRYVSIWNPSRRRWTPSI